MKKITNKRWFGPKYIDYGPCPKFWEGWVVIIVWWIFLVFSIFYLHSINLLNIFTLIIVIVLGAIILLKVAALTYGSD